MADDSVLTRRDGSTLVVELNRPDRLNAFDWPMFDGLEQLWAETTADPDVRVVVVTGAGRGFCAGADMGHLSAERKPRGPGVDEELAFLPGPHLDVPVVVAVNGVCAGGGLHFVADGDIVIASTAASFVDPHVTVGQVSALEPLTLALRVPVPVLMRMVLMGKAERLTADQALGAGLITEVVPPERLLPRALEIAAAIADGSPAAVAASRAALRSFERTLLHDALEAGWTSIQDHWSHPDALEGPVAFTEGRPPRWASRRQVDTEETESL